MGFLQGVVMFGKRQLLLVVCGCLLSHAMVAGASDWDSCRKALKNLQSASSSAGFLAFATARKQKQFEDSQALADKYSWFNERNQTTSDEYQRHVDGMEAALVDLQSAMFDVELSCYSSLSLHTSQSKNNIDDKSRNDMCLKLKRYTQTMPPEEQLDFCERVRFPGDCKKCLAPK